MTDSGGEQRVSNGEEWRRGGNGNGSGSASASVRGTTSVLSCSELLGVVWVLLAE